MVKSRILLVDDDPAIRFSVGDFLESRGYEVEEAGSLRPHALRFAKRQ